MFLMRMMLELFGRLKMIEIAVNTLVFSMLVFGLVIFIKMRRRMPKILNHLYNAESTTVKTTIESKTLVNPKIE